MSAMGEHVHGSPPGDLGHDDEEAKVSTRTDPLPRWLSILVVLVLLALLAFCILVMRGEGVAYSYVLGGLLGAYAGVDQLLKRRDGGNGEGGG